ncbi:MAGUK p55 subfamily member 3 isoform X8 [Callithrix jacchus]
MDEGTYIHALDNGLFTLGAPHREESAGRGQDVWTDTSMPVLSEDSGLHETLALLTSQLRPDSSHKEEMGFLRDVFSEKSLSYLMKAVLMVHDTVAQKNFDPVLPCLPDNIDEDFDEESVKIVRPLGEEQGTLGATIRRDEHSGAVVVARIIRGGAADRSGLVHVGDELREVNGIAVLHKRPDEISQIVAQSQGSITLKMIPATQEEDCLKESKMIGLVTKRPVTVRATSKGTMWVSGSLDTPMHNLPHLRLQSQGEVKAGLSEPQESFWSSRACLSGAGVPCLSSISQLERELSLSSHWAPTQFLPSLGAQCLAGRAHTPQH